MFQNSEPVGYCASNLSQNGKISCPSSYQNNSSSKCIEDFKSSILTNFEASDFSLPGNFITSHKMQGNSIKISPSSTVYLPSSTNPSSNYSPNSSSASFNTFVSSSSPALVSRKSSAYQYLQSPNNPQDYLVEDVPNSPSDVGGSCKFVPFSSYSFRQDFNPHSISSSPEYLMGENGSVKLQSTNISISSSQVLSNSSILWPVKLVASQNVNQPVHLSSANLLSDKSFTPDSTSPTVFSQQLISTSPSISLGISHSSVSSTADPSISSSANISTNSKSFSFLPPFPTTSSSSSLSGSPGYITYSSLTSTNPTIYSNPEIKNPSNVYNNRSNNSHYSTSNNGNNPLNTKTKFGFSPKMDFTSFKSPQTSSASNNNITNANIPVAFEDLGRYDIPLYFNPRPDPVNITSPDCNNNTKTVQVIKGFDHLRFVFC
jgi:hypothetical protein